MFTHIAVRLAAIGLQGSRIIFVSRGSVAGLALVAGLLAGCSTVPRPGFATRAADAAALVPSSTYQSVTRGYTSQRPADPLTWREQNDRVAPRAKGDAQ